MAAASAATAATAAPSSPLADFASAVDNSWVAQLTPDPDTAANAPNRSSREVRSGHYVLVKPTPLRDPVLVSYSKDLADTLGLSEAACASDAFVRLFSGDTGAVPGFENTWATPYALSIYGQEMIQNCPFGTGNGYGDGRAISLAEVVVSPNADTPISDSAASTGKAPSPTRWELQLKGAGPTPFCRGADGRAVLRSSVREFLVSEAMHALGVSTTRALSLVVSTSDTVRRPWYAQSGPQPEVDPAALASVPEQLRPLLMAQLQAARREPNVMQSTPCAITCRVAPSFARVGHVELFARRYRETPGRTTRRQLQQIVEHIIFREFPEIDAKIPCPPQEDDGPEARKVLQQRALCLLEKSAEGIAKLTADWLRVGFGQGNFNSDNCLVAGRTMDYGPFGFMERYDPDWVMWTGGGRHFGFRNQPEAGAKNFESLAGAVAELFDPQGEAEVKRLINETYPTLSLDAQNDVWRRKLGLSQWTGDTQELHFALEGLMQRTRPDWTLFWRQLAASADIVVASGEATPATGAELFAPLEVAFSPEFLPEGNRKLFLSWLEAWQSVFVSQDQADVPATDRVVLMRKTSPKYVPREWMLVDAYQDAHMGNLDKLHELEKVFAHPYDEQPEFQERFYKRPPEEALTRGGTAFMT